MLKNYFKVAFRNLTKFKTFSLINIAGLSISFAVVLLIAAFAWNEMQIDKFQPNLNRIYKISKGTTPVPIADILRTNVPELRNVAVVDIQNAESVTIKYGDKPLLIKNIIYADTQFFNIFSFKTVQGNLASALSTPMSIALTQNQSERIFGNDNPIGKTIKMNNEFNLTVNAVLKDIPKYSSIQFNGVISLKSLKNIYGKNRDPFDWSQWNYCSYVLFPQNANTPTLIKRINTVLKKNIPEEDKKINVDVIPFKGMYYSPDVFGLQKYGSIDKNIALISIAILILLIAIINYMNLSTARAAMRAKEIGIRKTIGASRFTLINQYLSESVLFSIISIAISLMLAELLLPFFNVIVNANITLFFGSVTTSVFTLILTAIILGILSGMYPAFYLTSYKPDAILRGNVSLRKGRNILRRGLIIFQFTIAVVLIISTIVIYNQMEYVRNKPLGFIKDNIIYFPTNDEINKNAFKSEILQQSSVEDFVYTFDVPGKMFMRWGMPFKYEGKQSKVWFTAVFSSSEYMKMMNMKIVEGRGFYVKDTTDYWSAIVNEAFLKSYNVKKPFTASFVEGKKIVGVVKDFNYQSLRSKVDPLVFFNVPVFNDGVIKLKSSKYSDIKTIIQKLKTVWKKYSPDFPLEYNFLDES
ncbi:MAG: ABC transporter permease, partial [Ignavibacteriaceae bacterium]